MQGAFKGSVFLMFFCVALDGTIKKNGQDLTHQQFHEDLGRWEACRLPALEIRGPD